VKILLTVKESFEKVLIREIAARGFKSLADGKGWVLAEGNDPAALQQDGGLCFAVDILLAPQECEAASVNSLARALTDIFITHLGPRKADQPWGCRFFAFGDEKLGRYADTLKERWQEALRKKMSRVAKLAQDGTPRGSQFGEGFFVLVTDFHKALVSFEALSQGQQRMKLDPQSPSRSYLKLEEAFHIFARSPKEGEVVVDLGAAPGGWSLSALKRGATVIAVDNGPLREPVKSHPKLTHLKTDALKYQPAGPGPVDWLLCDVLERPEMIVELLRKWLGKKWCRHFIVNLKVGRQDPIELIKEIRSHKNGLLSFCQSLSIRQLYHDREEITLMGTVKETTK
jgi:23S rRNA (cytidine2498-2'-O)-methyltransferase